MKYFDWNELKNSQLMSDREVCFEDIVVAIFEEKLIDVLEHPNATKYPNQKVYVVLLNQYIYLVPYVEDEQKIFLKTIYPSRKLTKKYFKGDKL